MDRNLFAQVHFHLPRKLWAKFKEVATLKGITATKLLISLIYDETSERNNDDNSNSNTRNCNY